MPGLKIKLLKGGLFLYSTTNFDSRVTVDVDFLIRQIPNTSEQLKSILEEIIAVQTEALRKTFSNREHYFTAEQFDRIMGFGDDMAMQKRWKAFVRKIDIKTDDYSIVLKTIKAFLTKPFTAAVEGKELTEQWIAANGERM